jgi:hypothetical protein
VTLTRREELQGAVAMVLVGRGDEAADSAACAGGAIEGLGGKVGPIFERLKQGLRVGVVVARPRSATRGHHAEALQGREHDGAIHGHAVFRKQPRGLARHAQRGDAPR